MPRIRSIKPEFFSSEQVVECSATARLLFIGMWCFCDDGGVHPASAARLKMEVLPGDPVTTREVEKLVQELKDANLLETYRVDGKDFWRVTGWKHQRIDKPTYQHPLSREFVEDSENARRMLLESSPPESSRVESMGEERKGVEEDCNEAAPRPSLPPVFVSPELLEYPTFGCIRGKRTGAQTWTLTTEFISELQQTFEAIDVAAECRKAWQWHKTNWTKRKTVNGMPDFIRRWIARANDSGRGKPKVAPPQSRVPTAADDENWNPHDAGGAL